MKKRPATQTLWKVSVSTSPEAEEALVEAMSELFDSPASVYADVELQTTVVSVFVTKYPDKTRTALRQRLATLRQAGLNPGPARLTARRIPRENWAESWKRHFHPLEISSRLLVLPSWSKRKPKRGQSVVILDPGLSFGTGHHPTTAFCLEQLSTARTSGQRQSLLDVGSGSGILSIAAAKLGYAPVEAFDFDPDAVRVAQENAVLNGVKIGLSQRDLTREPLRARRRFDVVCANLIYDLLIQERRRILNRLAPDGLLILAGILQEQFPAVRQAFEQEGLKLVAQRLAGEWRSGAFRFGS